MIVWSLERTQRSVTRGPIRDRILLYPTKISDDNKLTNYSTIYPTKMSIHPCFQGSMGFRKKRGWKYKSDRLHSRFLTFRISYTIHSTNPHYILFIILFNYYLPLVDIEVVVLLLPLSTSETFGPMWVGIVLFGWWVEGWRQWYTFKYESYGLWEKKKVHFSLKSSMYTLY